MGTTGEMARPDMNPVIQHFGHPHPLKLLNFQPQTTNTFICAGCKYEATGCFYFCSTCSYCLHKTCAGMPQYIQHLVDRKHPLVLLPSPGYATGSFKCNACGKLGTGFSYHCKDCQLDIHSLCIYKPSLVNTSTHHHTLKLCFSPPYSEKKFQCDICKKFGSNHWLYRCGSCDYDVHMNCATSNQVQPATEIQQTNQHILCPTDRANTQFQSVGAIQTQQTHQKQLLCHTGRANTYARPVSGIQQTQQQPQLLKSQSFPPQFSEFRTDLPNSGSTFCPVSQPVIPMPVSYVQPLNPIPGTGSPNWHQPYNVNGYTASMPTSAVHQQVPQTIHQINGYTAGTPTIATVPQYIQPPYTKNSGNNLLNHVVQELVDGFVQQAGGLIFQSATSGDLPFDLDIGNS